MVQFDEPLTESDHIKLAKFIADYPNVPLRIYGHYSNPPQNLSFLKHYPFVKHLVVDAFEIQSVEGLEHVESLDSFGFGQTKTKKLSLNFLRRFPGLKRLYLEQHTSDIEVLSEMTNLEQLTLRSITLSDLKLLLPLQRIWWLGIKLGGTSDLRLLPEVGTLKYLELWRVKGLKDVSMIGKVPTLENLFLQALRNVTSLPSFKNLNRLRRVTLDTMKGITDLSPIAAAPNLEELRILAATQLKPDDFKPFLGHPKLKAASIFFGNKTKNGAIVKLLGLPPSDGGNSDFVYGP